MRPAEFGEAVPAGTRSTLFFGDKPDRLFPVIKFWMDETASMVRNPGEQGSKAVTQTAGARIENQTIRRKNLELILPGCPSLSED
jgi:hypothetical protein